MEPPLAGTDTAIEQFKQLVPPISGRDPQPHHLLLIYGFAHAATIQLHQSFAAHSARAMEKCLGAAHSIARVAQTLSSSALGLTGGRVGIVNPMLGVSFAGLRPCSCTLTSVLCDCKGDPGCGRRGAGARAAFYAELPGAVDCEPRAAERRSTRAVSQDVAWRPWKPFSRIAVLWLVLFLSIPRVYVELSLVYRESVDEAERNPRWAVISSALYTRATSSDMSSLGDISTAYLDNYL